MRLFDSRTGIEVLERNECLALLANEQVGRVVTASAGQPEIFPVNYAAAGGTVVFRTAPGTKLRSALSGSVAFEIDGFEPDTRSGWSVVIHGRAESVDRFASPELLRTIEALPVDPWAAGRKDFFVRIVPRTITGRRIAPC